jgi:hypothetical protein
MALINTTTTGVLGSTFYGDGTGSLTIQQNGVTLNTITSAPAFRAKKSSNQNIASGAFTKLTFDTTDFNVGNCYDASTSRFTPTVAGYYSITGAIGTEGPSSTISRILITLYKNGGSTGNYLQDIQWASGNSVQGYVINGSDLLYLNGTTDYLEFYAYMGWTGNQAIAGAQQTRFSAFLARAA